MAPVIESAVGRKFTDNLALMLRARVPVIKVVTPEETRAEKYIAEAGNAVGMEVVFHDTASGVTDIAGREAEPGGSDARIPGQFITQLLDTNRRLLVVMRDTGPWFQDPATRRAMRNLVRAAMLSPPDKFRSVILLGTDKEVHPDLESFTSVLPLPPPDRAEIAILLDNVVDTLPANVKPTALPTPAIRDAAIDAAVGLTTDEIIAAYRQAIISSRLKDPNSAAIDPVRVAKEKKVLIQKSSGLELIDPDPRGLDAIGGLDNLKVWLTTRKAAFSKKARDFGLPSPKGLLAVGPPGTGKSLFAKACGTALGLPLVRLDLNATKGKFVGQSEETLRNTLRKVAAMAPAIVWIDEIEKALAGSAPGASADGGVSADALGQVLTFMQENEGGIFFVATANAVGSLPPELLRKGRFDDIFALDLPQRRERIEIFRVTVKNYKRNPDSLDLEALADASEGYTGSEIAASIPEGLFAAFADNERDLCTDDVMKALKATVPLSKTRAEEIKAIREWSQTRARQASSPETTTRATTESKVSFDFSFDSKRG